MLILTGIDIYIIFNELLIGILCLISEYPENQSNFLLPGG